MTKWDLQVTAVKNINADDSDPAADGAPSNVVGWSMVRGFETDAVPRLGETIGLSHEHFEHMASLLRVNNSWNCRVVNVEHHLEAPGAPSDIIVTIRAVLRVSASSPELWELPEWRAKRV
jgi:hypothetical protein